MRQFLIYVTVCLFTSVAFNGVPTSRADRNENWVFQFANGNRAFLSPTFTWFQVGQKEPLPRYGESIRAFQTTKKDAAGNEMGLIAQEGANQATIIPSEPSFVMFYKTIDGIYAMDDAGHSKVLAGLTDLIPTNDPGGFFVLPEVTSLAGRSYRAIGIKERTPDGKMKATIIAMDEYGITQHFEAPLLNPNLPVEFTLDLHYEANQTGVFTFGIKNGAKTAKGSMILVDWSIPGAIQAFADKGKQYLFGKLTENLVHYRSLTSVKKPIDYQLKRARRLIAALMAESKKTRQPSIFKVNGIIVPALAQLTQAMSEKDQISGSLEFLPMDPDAPSDEIDEMLEQWNKDIKNVAQNAVEHAYLVVVPMPTYTVVIYHPTGSSPLFADTLHLGCSVNFSKFFEE